MAIDHRLLCRVEPCAGPVETLHSDELLAVQSRQELDAGVHRSEQEAVAAAVEFGDRDCTCAAITFGAAFLGTRSAQVLAKKLQHRARRVDVFQFNDLAVQHETNHAVGLCFVGVPWCHVVQLPRYVE